MAARHHKQTATYWQVTGSNGYGGYAFADPVALSVRWEEREELFRDSEGEEQTSRAIVFLGQDVEIGDYLALGDYTATADPTDLDDAYRVMQFRKVTDLRNVKALRKAML